MQISSFCTVRIPIIELFPFPFICRCPVASWLTYIEFVQLYPTHMIQQCNHPCAIPVRSKPIRSLLLYNLRLVWGHVNRNCPHPIDSIIIPLHNLQEYCNPYLSASYVVSRTDVEKEAWVIRYRASCNTWNAIFLVRWDIVWMRYVNVFVIVSTQERRFDVYMITTQFVTRLSFTMNRICN